MKNWFKKMFVVTLFVMIGLSIGTPVFAENNEHDYSIDEAYTYPIIPETSEWNALETINDKLEACQIPEAILSELTTPALIESVANYPLSVNLYAYNNLEEGYNKVKEQFNGLAELERRMIKEPGKTQVAIDDFMQSNVKTVSDGDGFQSFYMNRIKDCLVRTSYGTPRAIITSLKTPMGSAVKAYYDFTWADLRITEEAKAANQEFLIRYSSTTLLRDQTPKYNCHSYAWYSTSVNNKYWIDDPSQYVLDGSYSELTRYYPGAILLYGTPGNDPVHSAIITTVSDGHLQYVTSKWGVCGLFKHLYFDSPYAEGVHTYRIR